MLLELSVVTNTQHHFLAARNCKEDCYSSLLLVDFVTVEVGCLGHFMPVTITKLSNVCHLQYQRVQYIAYFCRQLVLPSPARTGSLASALWDVVDLLICDRICKKGSSTHIQFTNFDNS